MRFFKVVFLGLVIIFNISCDNQSIESGSFLGIDSGDDEDDEVVVGQSFCPGFVSTKSSSLNVRTSPEIADNVCNQIDKNEQVKISLEGSTRGFFKIDGIVCGLTEEDHVFVSKKFITFDQNCAFEKDESIKSEVDDPSDEPDPEEDDQQTPVAIPMNWDGKHKDHQQWTSYVYEAVSVFGKDLLASRPGDIKTFCPNYSNLEDEEKKMFWMHLISSMTQFESGFRPNTKFQESFKDRDGNFIISRGLLQISIGSARGYDCDLEDAQDLHSPQKNLECGVRIINRWVRRDGRVAGKVDGKWRGGARYWSVLRKRASSRSHDRIAGKTRSTSICQ